MFVFIAIDEREECARNARRQLIIVGANGSAAAEAAAQWAVRGGHNVDQYGESQ